MKSINTIFTCAAFGSAASNPSPDIFWLIFLILILDDEKREAEKRRKRKQANAQAQAAAKSKPLPGLACRPENELQKRKSA